MGTATRANFAVSVRVHVCVRCAQRAAGYLLGCLLEVVRDSTGRQSSGVQLGCRLSRGLYEQLEGLPMIVRWRSPLLAFPCLFSDVFFWCFSVHMERNCGRMGL